MVRAALKFVSFENVAWIKSFAPLVFAMFALVGTYSNANTKLMTCTNTLGASPPNRLLIGTILDFTPSSRSRNDLEDALAKAQEAVAEFISAEPSDWKPVYYNYTDGDGLIENTQYSQGQTLTGVEFIRRTNRPPTVRAFAGDVVAIRKVTGTQARPFYKAILRQKEGPEQIIELSNSIDTYIFTPGWSGPGKL